MWLTNKIFDFINLKPSAKNVHPLCLPECLISDDFVFNSAVARIIRIEFGTYPSKLWSISLLDYIVLNSLYANQKQKHISFVFCYFRIVWMMLEYCTLLCYMDDCNTQVKYIFNKLINLKVIWRMLKILRLIKNKCCRVKNDPRVMLMK